MDRESTSRPSMTEITFTDYESAYRTGRQWGVPFYVRRVKTNAGVRFVLTFAG